ncbi:cache domain-containing protein, partial [bacterium]|nr:cache domain-containing protein [bacterium]
MRLPIPPINVFRNYPIRYKLLISYFLAFFMVITLGSWVVNSVVRKTIENNIESELKNSTSAILNLVKTSASVSIKNYFRSAAEKNRDVLSYFHEKYKKGELTLEEAKKQAGDILLSQTIGISGYIYCVDSYGNATLHPNKEVAGDNFADVPFIQKIITDREVYVQYNWKNPGELKARSKAVYVAYFKPWDWFICVSAYQEEFNKLVDVDDFKESILSFKFGKSGYAFLLDKKGEVIVHPKELVGQN